jgi:hypothetical protein
MSFTLWDTGLPSDFQRKCITLVLDDVLRIEQTFILLSLHSLRQTKQRTVKSEKQYFGWKKIHPRIGHHKDSSDHCTAF